MSGATLIAILALAVALRVAYQAGRRRSAEAVRGPAYRAGFAAGRSEGYDHGHCDGIVDSIESAQRIAAVRQRGERW